MSIFIEGPAFPLDEINANGWGVPKSEAENAINSLKSSVIRVCTRADPHICDLFEDPFAEIGRIESAWEQDGGIWARGIITDSAAEAKITEGTWGNSWSVFGYEDTNKDGFSQGFEARSMALVQFPAWETANWAIVAARAAGAKNRKPVSSASKVYTIFDDSTKTNKKSASKRDSMTDQDPTIKEILDRLEALEKGPDTPDDGGGVPGGEPGGIPGGIPEALAASIKAISASVKALDTEIKKKEERIASLEKQLSTAIPAEKFPDMLAAGIAEDKERERRAAAYARFAAVRLERGLETKEEDYKALTASDFERSIAELETLRPVAGGAQYPAGNPVQAGADTGIYDPYTKTFVKAGAK